MEVCIMLPSIFSENLFDDFFGKDLLERRSALYGKHGKNLMKTDVQEKDDCYLLEVDLPGFKKDEISVDVENGYLTISAAKGLDKEKKDKKGRYIRQERYAGSLSRCFYIGDKKPEDVKAKYEDGSLTVSFPKESPKALPDSKKVTIE